MKEKREVVELVNRVKQNDQEAFQKLYEIYANNVYFTAWDYFHNEHTAKDIVQDVFIRVHKKLDTLESPEAFGTWIKRITINMCYDYDKKKKYMIDLGEDITVDDFEDLNQKTAKEILDNKEIVDTVYESIQSLTTPLRTVGLLRYYDELSVSEIAYVLQIPVGTVNSRLNSLRSKLKVKLERQGISVNSLQGFALSPLLLHTVYMSAAESVNVPTMQIAKAVGAGSVATIGTKFALGTGTKIAIASVVSVAGIVGIALFNQDTPSPSIAPPPIEKEVVQVESAKIQDIVYPTAWTNKTITLQVQTTNDVYDKILVNGNESLEIAANGSYVVSLEYQGKQIDERVIEIQNFDMHSPVIENYTINGTNYVIRLFDEQSMVNFSSLRYYEDGIQKPKDIQIDTVNQSIILDCDYGVTAVLYVADHTGNELKITLHDKVE